jgi:hypothetical protein
VNNLILKPTLFLNIVEQSVRFKPELAPLRHNSGPLKTQRDLILGTRRWEGGLSLRARRIVLTKLSGFGERPFVGTAQTGESTSMSPTTMNNSNTNKSFGGERTKVMGDPNDVHFPYIRDNTRIGTGWHGPPESPAHKI